MTRTVPPRADTTRTDGTPRSRTTQLPSALTAPRLTVALPLPEMVTLRERDMMKQERVALEKVLARLRKRLVR